MKAKTTKIGITNNKISARGGLSLFLRYTEQIGFYNMISGILNGLFSTNNKGLQLKGFLKQMLAFFMDGTNMSIKSFDVRKSHERGADELIHRSIKELATKEQLPFKSFGMNRAYYIYVGIYSFPF